MKLDLLVDAVVAQQDWSTLQEVDGAASRLPAAFFGLLASTGPDSAVAAYWKLENHVVVQGALFDASVCVVSLIGAALADLTRPKWVKIQLLELLFQIVNGESHADEVARGVADLGPRCRKEARKMLWILYGIFQEGDLWRAAREIIERVDDNEALITSIDRVNQQNGRCDASDAPSS